MAKTLRFGTALSALAIASVLGGCATPQSEPRQSIFGDRFDKSNVALATRAAAAIAAEDFAKATDLAERAVANSPRDAGFRALLGNAYFGGGRFASAEAAYRDSLSLLSNQPQVVLKLALVQIAQGKSGEALEFLEAARPVLDPADYGLAVALAGDKGRAVQVLDEAARQVGADARTRQNLALAHALAGDWTAARTVAAQDLPADQLDARIQQWAALASPVRPYDQVAALTGVTPAAVDPGQPARLALVDAPVREAAAEVPQPAPVVVEASPPVVEPVPVAQLVAVPVPAPAPALSQPVTAPEPPAVAEAAPAAPTVEKPPVRSAAFVPAAKPVRKAAFTPARGRSSAVVQLGAYSSRDNVSAAWASITRRYPALRDYTPMIARFDSSKGVVYRLSIRGFDSQKEAIARCSLLRGRGGSCFVRATAGDAPVQFASR